MDVTMSLLSGNVCGLCEEAPLGCGCVTRVGSGAAGRGGEGRMEARGLYSLPATGGP
jgi:hypothetical protein